MSLRQTNNLLMSEGAHTMQGANPCPHICGEFKGKMNIHTYLSQGWERMDIRNDF